MSKAERLQRKSPRRRNIQSLVCRNAFHDEKNLGLPTFTENLLLSLFFRWSGFSAKILTRPRFFAKTPTSLDKLLRTHQIATRRRPKSHRPSPIHWWQM